MTANGEMLRELRKISKLLLLTNAKIIEEELSKIATTDDRKKMWVSINGSRMPKDIANEVKVTQMAVSNFLNAGEAAGLIEYKRGEPPWRLLDYVPPNWIELLTPTQVKEAESAQSEKPQVTLDTVERPAKPDKEEGSE